MTDELPEYVITEIAEEAFMGERKRRRGMFVENFLEQKKKELGTEKVEKNREKLAKKGAELYDRAQKAKAEYYELEEESRIKVTNWSALEKLLRTWLECEGAAKGWGKDVIENTIKARQRDFQRVQSRVKAKLEAKKQPSEEEAFRKGILNPDPEIRKNAIQYFLHDNVAKKHYLVETVALVLNEICKLKSKRR